MNHFFVHQSYFISAAHSLQQRCSYFHIHCAYFAKHIVLLYLDFVGFFSFRHFSLTTLSLSSSLNNRHYSFSMDDTAVVV